MMRADLQQIKRALKSGKIEELFKEELSWNKLSEASSEIEYRGQEYTFKPVAQKVGFKIYQHIFNGRIPEDRILYQLSKKLDTSAAEHLAVFFDASRENQAWVWVKKELENNKERSKVRIRRFNRLQSGDLLAQKLESLFVSLDEEELVTLTTIRARVQQGFDVEKITKTFYIQFKDRHADFLKQIENIPDDDEHKEDREWYASIMLNRLMFVYFIQRKGLLNNHSAVHFNGDKEYLQNRLRMTQENPGPDKFYAFYRYFLRRLFHEGLSLPEADHTPELESIIGKVPYINGGLFDVHILEQRYPEIKIKDKAFEQVFAFFENFDWHLDDRLTRNGNEINPDVLGYIFEKYINQKQMGAYYTKEDITEYISKNTIIPFIFEKVASLHPDAFSANGSIWSPLQEQPDEYIYDAMAHGTLEPLPQEIEVGRTNVTQRTSWNQSADELWALPTETWREVVERRQRHEEIRTKMVNGEISTINDLITYNLDITQFARDVIAACEEPGLLRAFYDTIEQVTVLDPTCGSGAFLFAALNILKPLYQTCIERMRVLVAQYKAQKKESNHIHAFKQTLERVESHKSQDYFILKSIIVKNLYGVDIMEEAIEICKLRLFLKLVAQIESPRQLEPLPDIDFNVLAGNTLIGFTSLDEVRRVVDTKLFSVDDTEQTLQLIVQDAQDIERDEQSFRNMQTKQRMELDSVDIAAHKRQLREKLERLRGKLDPYLATEYGVYTSKYEDKGGGINYEQAYAQWQKSHKPFHWWAEFYKIMCDGGFSVIIGNPPYVEYSKVRDNYTIKNYKTEKCGNLHSYVMERCIRFLQPHSFVGLIIPHSVAATYRMQPIQEVLLKKLTSRYSYFSRRPGKLFEGADQCLCIVIGTPMMLGYEDVQKNVSTTYQRWYTEERDSLFGKMHYLSVELEKYWKIFHVFPKLGTEIEETLLNKMIKHRSLGISLRSSGAEFYCHRISRYFIKSTNFIPYFCSERDGIKRSDDFKVYQAENVKSAILSVAVLNSSLFYWFWRVMFDGYHCGKDNISVFPFEPSNVLPQLASQLENLTEQLMVSFQKNSVRKTVKYKGSGMVEYDEFSVKYSKPIIDEIDRILAQHYGFTPEELDFIINYDIKYRMGRDSGEESEE